MHFCDKALFQIRQVRLRAGMNKQPEMRQHHGEPWLWAWLVVRTFWCMGRAATMECEGQAL